MATSFPAALDDFTNYVDGTTVMESVTLNDMQFAIEAMEAKVGIDNSIVTSSHDYKLANPSGRGWSPNAESADTGSIGVTVLSNGLRIARGVKTVTAGAEDTITPSGFTKIYNVQLTIESDSTTDWFAPKLGNVNDTTFTIRNTNTSGLEIHWLCIGR